LDNGLTINDCRFAAEIGSGTHDGGETVSNLAPWQLYLIAGPTIGLGAILFFYGIIQLLEKRGSECAAKAEVELGENWQRHPKATGKPRAAS